MDAEENSRELTELPSDFYVKAAAYCSRIRRSAGFGSSELSVTLAAAQTRMVRSVTRSILALRIGKAAEQNSVHLLLPEERSLASAKRRYESGLEAFMGAVSGGRPSYLGRLKRTEEKRGVAVKFTKRVGEIVGVDQQRYGPFEVEDIACLPAESAAILVSGGDAVIVTEDIGA